ncbi:DUF4266 domain-containing protein [Marinimicrobium alkaliphilum]|uniref:DUF4266 domain-containing protein n=1 Tax=Marinimicrobium alkaliphilum TaxID=2202654 RepID=UPI000DB99DBA|nr:DUF4266 domain-containing protein [Marinimicrobium alkaliphilum]
MRIKTLTLLGVLLVSVSACTQVQPWERNYLARPEMALEPDPMGALLRSHIHHSKEAASSVSSGSGGGCGCN